MNKLDLKTKLFLYITRANNLGVPNFDISKIDINEEKARDVYVFDSYEDYFNYFKAYLKNVNEELIQKAIYTTGKKGQIVALKGLCERIIIKQRTKEFYESFDQEKIDEIHSKGKITPMEKVSEYESSGLCAPGDAIGSARNRCRFFSNCHECLLEYASHNQEYDKFDFKIVNSDIDKKVLKKHNKEKYIDVMIGYGENSTFTKIKKGEEVMTRYGNIIEAGLTLEEEQQRLEEDLDDILYIKPAAYAKTLRRRLKK